MSTVGGWAGGETCTPSLLRWMAWRRYLTSTRDRPPDVYAIVEEEAWRRLETDLAPRRTDSIPTALSSESSRHLSAS